MKTETPIDLSKATGTCVHGNFLASCASCAKENELSREIEAFVLTELGRELAAERKAEMTKHLLIVEDFFRDAGIDVFLAGGGGLDLLDGEWNRDHQDLDMAIFETDAQHFYDAAVRAGFGISDYTLKPLTEKEILEADRHNAFVHRADHQGEIKFEVMFLNAREETQILYEQAPITVIEGREVKIQPPEIILYYKLSDCRRKDFRDIKNIWVSLTDQQRTTVGDLLRNANVRFEINGKEIIDIPTLIDSATKAEEEKHQTFFQERISTIETDVYKDLMANCEVIFDIRQNSHDPQTFLEAMVKKYHGFMPEQRPVLEAMTDYLYQSNSPSITQFQTWAKQTLNRTDQLKQKALYEYVSEKLWAVKH